MKSITIVVEVGDRITCGIKNDLPKPKVKAACGVVVPIPIAPAKVLVAVVLSAVKLGA